MEKNHFNDDQVSVPCGKTTSENRSVSRFEIPRFSESNPYPRIPFSVNRLKLSTPYKSELCRLFERGKCYFGGNCHYAHSMSEIVKPGIKAAAMEELLNEETLRNAVSKVRECYFFSSGQGCPYGDRCHYLHKFDRNVGSRVALYAVSGRSEKSESDQIVCGGLNACRNHAKSVNYKRKLCIRWEKSGRCAFGLKCNYAHGKAELQKHSHVAELKHDRACRLMLDSQPNNAESYEIGNKTAEKLQMKGKRCFMKWDIEKISETYADWMDMNKIS